MSIAGPTLLSLGSINADFQLRLDRPPDTGQTLIGRDFVRLSGGKAANVAFLTRRLGVPAQLFGRIGDDELSEQALRPLRQAGVDVSGVMSAAGCPTAVSMIAVLPDGKKCIALANNANDVWGAGDLQPVLAAIKETPEGSVLVIDYELPPAIVRKAVIAAAERRLPIVIDPSPADRVELAVLAHSAAVTPNPAEAEGLTGIKADGLDGAAAAARWLLEHDAGVACVKFADGGCVVAGRGGEAWVVEAVPVPVVDTTGAGDAFAGAFAVALMERRPLVGAACFAAAASHLAVTGYGSQPAYPTRAQIEDLLPALLAKTRRLSD
jgi:ribokinase